VRRSPVIIVGAAVDWLAGHYGLTNLEALAIGCLAAALARRFMRRPFERDDAEFY
jgi:hypothetical protein